MERLRRRGDQGRTQCTVMSRFRIVLQLLVPDFLWDEEPWWVLPGHNGRNTFSVCSQGNTLDVVEWLHLETEAA